MRLPGSLDNAPVEQSAVTAAAEGIGEKLTLLRTHRGIKVTELARSIGVSPSLISQIERGQSRPSVSTLFAMAEALSVPVDAFYRGTESEPPMAAEAARDVPPMITDLAPPRAVGEGGAAAPAERDRYVVRRDERATLDIEGGVRWERLTPKTLSDVEFFELVYAPGAESNATLYRHPGREMLLMTAGQLHIYIGFERYEISPGDSLMFPSTMPHRYVNPGDVEARGVAVTIHDAPTPPESRPG
jgi:transcriptional regulator with XRE-family HTH domain